MVMSWSVRVCVIGFQYNCICCFLLFSYIVLRPCCRVLVLSFWVGCGAGGGGGGGGGRGGGGGGEQVVKRLYWEPLGGSGGCM